MSKRLFYIAMSIVSVILSSQANAAFIRSENVNIVDDSVLIKEFSHSVSTDIRPYDGAWGSVRAVKQGDSVIAEFKGGCDAIRGCGANILATATLKYQILLDFVDRDGFFAAFDDPFNRLNVGVNYHLSLFGSVSDRPTSAGIIQGPQFRPTDRRLSASIEVEGNHSNQVNPVKSTLGTLAGNSSSSRSGTLFAVVNPLAEQMYIDVTLNAFVRAGVRGTSSSSQSAYFRALADPYITLPEEYASFLQVTNTSFSLAGDSSSFGTPPNTVPSPSTISILSLLVPFLILRKKLKLKNAA